MNAFAFCLESAKTNDERQKFPMATSMVYKPLSGFLAFTFQPHLS